MNHDGIAEVGALVGDETRARTLVALMDGLALPAGELARLSNVSAGTISAHLSKLVDGGLLKVEAQGKHRYYRLAGPKVATLIESFGTLVQLRRWRSTKVPHRFIFIQTSGATLLEETPLLQTVWRRHQRIASMTCCGCFP